MRSADYPYPPDEFDAAAGAGGPRGVHRTPRSAWSRWWPFLVAVIVFPALAFGAVTWLSSWDGLPGAGADDETTTSSTPADTGSPAETTPPTDTATATPTPTETTPELPPVDLARDVRVDNATQTSGLAGGARDELEAAGFTSVTTGNWDGEDTGSTVVFYPAAADLGTATEIAALLGIPRVEENAEAAGDVVLVVLEAEYQP